MSDAWKMQAAAEETRSAANRMMSASEEMKQAMRNMDGSIEQLRCLWERQIYPDLCSLMDRLEVIQIKEIKT